LKVRRTHEEIAHFRTNRLISAYMDGRCTPREKVLVESLLKTNPAFKQALIEFKRSKRMLAAIPVVKAPRDFTLSPRQVPHKPKRFLPYRVLNYGALTAVILCAVLFAGNYLLPNTYAASAASEAAPMLAAVSEDTASAATDIPMITWGYSGGMGGGGAEGEPYGKGGGMPSDSTTLSTEAPLPESTAEPMLQQAATEEPTTDTSNLILGLPESESQGQILTPEAFPLTREVEPRTPISWMVIGGIGLAILALGLALAAWFVKKRY
jgi:hypothetical protein